MDKVNKISTKAAVGCGAAKLTRAAGRRVTAMLFYICAYFLLLVGFRAFIVPVFGYSGFIWDPNAEKIIESALIVLVVALFLPASFKKPSDILLHLQFLFPVLPMLVIYGAGNQPRGYMYATIGTFLGITLVVGRLRLRPVAISCRLSPRLYQRLLLTAGWGVIATIILLGGWRYFNLNIWKVYQYRSIAAANLPKIFGYISPLTGKVIFPFALLIAVVYEEKIAAFLSLAGSVMVFGLTAHKGPLFYPFAVLTLYFLLNFRHVIKGLLVGYMSIAGLSLLLYTFWEHISFGSLMLRRVYFIPAKLNFLYYDFFSHHQFAYWARSKITFSLLDYNYSLDIPHLIGDYYFNRPECGANTGWIGSGYANAGYLGMFVCAAMVALLMALFDAYGKVIDKRIIVAIVTAPLLAIFMASDIFTALLTHGTMAAVLLLMFYPASALPLTYQRKTNLWAKKVPLI